MSSKKTEVEALYLELGWQYQQLSDEMPEVLPLLYDRRGVSSSPLFYDVLNRVWWCGATMYPRAFAAHIVLSHMRHIHRELGTGVVVKGRSVRSAIVLIQAVRSFNQKRLKALRQRSTRRRGKASEPMTLKPAPAPERSTPKNNEPTTKDRLRWSLESLANHMKAARAWELVADTRDAMPGAWTDTQELLAAFDEARVGAVIGPMYATDGKGTGKDLEKFLGSWLQHTRGALQDAQALVRDEGARLLGPDHAKQAAIELRKLQSAIGVLSCSLKSGHWDVRGAAATLRALAGAFQTAADRVAVRASLCGRQ